MTSDVTPPMHAELRRLDIPLAVIDPAGVPTIDVPTVGATNWAGGLRATEHLLSLGHRRIGFIAGPKRLLCSRARLDGHGAALAAAGLATDPDLIQQGDFYHESGCDGAEALLRLADPAPRRSSPPATRWPSGRTRPSASAACGCPTTSRWSASTTSRRAAGRRRR
ncbi:hypothetical protein GCM10020218_086660 [Dactylosporangium vinaceum]